MTNKDIKLQLKIFPFISNSTNRNGNNVGDVKAVLIGDDFPITDFDGVDNAMHNLIGYLNDRNTSPKEKKEKNLYFDNHKIYEIKYTEPIQIKGGKQRKTIKKTKKSKKNKRNKRKTYKR